MSHHWQKQFWKNCNICKTYDEIKSVSFFWTTLERFDFLHLLAFFAVRARCVRMNACVSCSVLVVCCCKERTTYCCHPEPLVLLASPLPDCFCMVTHYTFHLHTITYIHIYNIYIYLATSPKCHLNTVFLLMSCARACTAKKTN